MIVNDRRQCHNAFNNQDVIAYIAKGKQFLVLVPIISNFLQTVVFDVGFIVSVVFSVQNMIVSIRRYVYFANLSIQTEHIYME